MGESIPLITILVVGIFVVQLIEFNVYLADFHQGSFHIVQVEIIQSLVEIDHNDFEIFRSIRTSFRVRYQGGSFRSNIAVVLVDQVFGGFEILITIGGVAEHEFYVSLVKIIKDAIFTRGLLFVLI